MSQAAERALAARSQIEAEQDEQKRLQREAERDAERRRVAEEARIREEAEASARAERGAEEERLAKLRERETNIRRLKAQAPAKVLDLFLTTPSLTPPNPSHHYNYDHDFY